MSGIRMRRAAWLAAVALAVAGCGDVPSGAASGVATNYFRRTAARDFAGACRLFSADLRNRLGDCAGAVQRGYEELPVGEQRTLGQVTVHSGRSHGSAEVRIATRDVGTVDSVTVKVNGTPKPRSSWTMSFAAYHMTNGHGMVLDKIDGTWQISACGL
ncbi:hypothetical protein ODJ79_27155 [Actinoplanes sp. KI2]|uniref:hypothetical protein n=1 Tax=Actinoplanes sp. KI2 TaxID=2983315 RepID=UPI0021D5C006|nr:hypothetical protein [Actinoplanes sp. KI2]MCU7727427.1 hypothetical protein [Actinoplanes sp. KI2]